MRHSVITSLLVLWLGTTSCHGSVTCDTVCACQNVSASDVTVHCSGCSLTAIPADIPADVTSLDVAFNAIESLDGNGLPSFPRLSRLDLSNNRLVRMAPGAFRRLGGALQDLDMDGNRLQRLTPFMFSQAPHLKLLSLGSNSISMVEARAFSNLSLDRLSLRDNTQLVSLDERAFWDSRIHTLILDRCGFVTLPAESLRPLVHSLAVLSISEMPGGFSPDEDNFRNLNLTSLHLIKNKMIESDLLCFRYILEVRNVDLSGNNFRSLNMSLLGGHNAIEHLVLKSSNIEQLHTYCDSPISRFDALKSLDISRNALASLPDSMFYCFPELRTLKMSWIPLESLSSSLEQSFDNIEELDIANISLSCDCELEWFLNWRLRTDTTVYGSLCSNVPDTALNCAAPQTVTSWITSQDDEQVRVSCRTDGDPMPDMAITGHSSTGAVNVSVGHKDQVSITVAIHECSKFKCVAENTKGRRSHSFHVCPQDERDPSEAVASSHAWVVAPVLVVVLFIVIVILVTRKCKGLCPQCSNSSRDAYYVRTDSSESSLIRHDPC